MKLGQSILIATVASVLAALIVKQITGSGSVTTAAVT